MIFLLLLPSTQALWVYIINVAFSALAVFHLAYLGSLFNSSVDYMDDDDDEVTIYWMVSVSKMAKYIHDWVIVRSFRTKHYGWVRHFKPMSTFSPFTEWRGQPHHSEVVGAELGQPLGDVWLLGALPHHPLNVWGRGSERALGTERHIEKGSNNKRELMWACWGKTGSLLLHCEVVLDWRVHTTTLWAVY